MWSNILEKKTTFNLTTGINVLLNGCDKDFTSKDELYE